LILVCNATTQLTLQLQQERIQLVRSNKVVRRIPIKSNNTPSRQGPWTHKCCFEVMYLYVGRGLGKWIGMIIIGNMFCFVLFCFDFFPLYFPHLFFVSQALVSKTQPNHWTKRMVGT